ncbi:MAG: hypothetical protein H0W70_10000 [Actinobacteria bacterium]|nr:hypothetical protein [Actinomycetota bacterium]
MLLLAAAAVWSAGATTAQIIRPNPTTVPTAPSQTAPPATGATNPPATVTATAPTRPTATSVGVKKATTSSTRTATTATIPDLATDPAAAPNPESVNAEPPPASTGGGGISPIFNLLSVLGFAAAFGIMGRRWFLTRGEG